MCLSSFWTALQLLWSSVYVLCGTGQLVAGIFFLISVPALHFTSNLVVGLVNIVMGIAGGAIVLFGRLSPRRQEALLYIACSVLIVNLAAAILREWGLYFQDYTKILKDHPHHLYILYGCFATRIAAAAVIVVSFLDSQSAFCSMQIKHKNHRTGPRLKDKRSYDNSADVEFIIPKQKPSKSPSKPHAIYNAYAQSWVFETSDNLSHGNPACSTAKSVQNGNPANINSSRPAHNNNNNVTKLRDDSENPVVRIEEASDDSTSNSDRKLGHMKSFSRAPSPVMLSAGSSQLSLSLTQPKPQIYEYLEKLTEPEVYRSRLNSALSESRDVQQNVQKMGSVSPNSENVQYASFMQELQRAIGSKKDGTPTPSTTSGSLTNTSGKSDDGDFNRELEAALQLIQDLDTPTDATVGVVDEPKLSTFKPATNGKNRANHHQNHHHHPNSQSTSGYSSPTTPQNWSTASSISSQHEPISYTIHNSKLTTVISLYTPPANNDTSSRIKSKSVTLVSISGDNEPIIKEQEAMSCNRESLLENSGRKTTQGWRSLLRKNRRETPKLCPELEGAIVKSESLAYLSEIELLARHQRNSELHRKIEERVIQQLAVPRTESHC